MKSIKNKTLSDIYLLGQPHIAGIWQTIPKNLETKYAMSEAVVNAIMAGDIVISADNSTELGKIQAINFLLNSSIVDAGGYLIQRATAFASKTIDGKGLFKRVHGIQLMTVVGLNTFEFVIPYNQCKITGIELIGASFCDIADLEVYDTPTGTLSAIPNYKLNQFGFTVNVAEKYYEHKSEFDSDLIKNMKIEVHLTAQAIGKVGLNLILNEVK
jgi:hypothetical protein